MEAPGKKTFWSACVSAFLPSKLGSSKRRKEKKKGGKRSFSFPTLTHTHTSSSLTYLDLCHNFLFLFWGEERREKGRPKKSARRGKSGEKKENLFPFWIYQAESTDGKKPLWLEKESLFSLEKDRNFLLHTHTRTHTHPSRHVTSPEEFPIETDNPDAVSKSLTDVMPRYLPAYLQQADASRQGCQVIDSPSPRDIPNSKQAQVQNSQLLIILEKKLVHNAFLLRSLCVIYIHVAKRAAWQHCSHNTGEWSF